MGAVVRPRRVALNALRGSTSGDGRDVGVVIVDEGFSRQHLIDAGWATAANFGGGFQLANAGSQNSTARAGRWHDPYRRQVDGHGNMVARNVLDLAPRATLWDAPVLPPRVTDLDSFAAGAAAVLHAIATVIAFQRVFPIEPKRHWIVVNAWGVATRTADILWRTGDPGAYLASRRHALNSAAIHLSRRAEVLFAAGNSGEHDPAPFAGAYDRGPYRSIWGANGLPEVTTVGATTLQHHIVAASSPGPTQAGLSNGAANPKPDVHRPSWFTENHDTSVLNSGTSAAVAVHAGLRAAALSAPTA